VVVVERVRTDGESVDVLEREEIARHSLSISDGATRTQDLNATPDIIGDRLRLSVFLFQGDVPDTPTAANADERLFLWIDVNRAAATLRRSPALARNMWPWEHLAFAYVLVSGYYRLAWRSRPTDAAAIVIAVGAVLPDLIDKPLAWGSACFPRAGRSPTRCSSSSPCSRW